MGCDTPFMKVDNTIIKGNLKEINVSTTADLKDTTLLKSAAQGKDGLVDAYYRNKIWPLLQPKAFENSLDSDWEDLPPHKDEGQLTLDVNRSFICFPLLINNKEKTQLRDQLKRILIRLLRTHPDLSYYQGLHDVCSVILLVFKDEFRSYQFFESFALLHLRDFMMPNLDSSLETLKIIPEILQSIDPLFYKKLELSTIQPFFCLSPMITLFSHDLKTLSSLGLIFDQILSYSSIIVIYYIYVLLLIKKKDIILKYIGEDNDDNCLNITDRIHNSLCKFLADVNYDDINQVALELPEILRKFPAKNLKSLKGLSSFSVLRSTSSIDDNNIDEPATALLSLQLQDLKRPRQQSTEQSLLLRLISPKTNQQLFKYTITLGVLSLIINVLLTNNPGLISQTWTRLVSSNWTTLLSVSRQFMDYFSR